MESVLVDLIPLMLGAAAAPFPVIIVLLLLRGESGLLKASAFVSGMVAMRLTQGIVFGLLFGAGDGDDEESRVIASTLLLVVGLLLWTTAIRKIRKEDDPDEPPPKWLTAMSAVTPFRALGFGLLLMLIAVKQWVFTLSAVGVIRAGDVERNAGILAYLLFLLVASLPALAPLILSAVMPGRSATLLASFGGWLDRNNRAIMIGVSVVFGTFFLYKGITGLTG